MRKRSKSKIIILILLMIGITILLSITSVRCDTYAKTVSTIGDNDAYVRKSTPASTYGNYGFIIVGFYDNFTEGYFHFSFEDKPNNYTKVEIYLYSYETTGSIEISVMLITEYWNEDTITWANKPDHGEIIKTISGGGGYYIDITDYINGDGISICLNASNNLQTNYSAINSLEGVYSDETPRLIWTYEEEISIPPSKEFIIFLMFYINFVIMLFILLGCAFLTFLYIRSQKKYRNLRPYELSSLISQFEKKKNEKFLTIEKGINPNYLTWSDTYNSNQFSQKKYNILKKTKFLFPVLILFYPILSFILGIFIPQYFYAFAACIISSIIIFFVDKFDLGLGKGIGCFILVLLISMGIMASIASTLTDFSYAVYTDYHYYYPVEFDKGIVRIYFREYVEHAVLSFFLAYIIMPFIVGFGSVIADKHKDLTRSYESSTRNINESHRDALEKVKKILNYIKKGESLLSEENIVESLNIFEQGLNNLKRYSGLLPSAYNKRINDFLIKKIEKTKSSLSDIEQEKLERKRKIREKLEREFPIIEKLIEEEEFSSAKKKLNKIIQEAKPYNLDGTIDWAMEMLNLADIKEKTKNIKQILIVENENQKEITKADLVRDLNLNIDDAEKYIDLLNSSISYTTSEIPTLKSNAEDLIKKLAQPTLYDLIVDLGYNFDTAKKIGQYLIEEGWINEFPRISIKKVMVERPKELEKVGEISSPVKISRGFEVAGDTFRFFVRVGNALNYAITNTSVRIQLPNTLLLDEKTPSNTFNIGNIAPYKFGTAIFYLFCLACADTEINAAIEYIDPKGNFQVAKMEPFQIFSCKYITPRQISSEEFNQKFQAKEKKTVKIKLKEGFSEKQILQMLKNRMTMSTISSSSNSLDMSGITRDGMNVLLKSNIEEQEGEKMLIVSIVSENQHVQMGALSDVMEEFRELRREFGEKLEAIKKGQEDLKITIIRETSKILTNQIEEFDSIESKNHKLRKEIKKLRRKFDEFEGSGEFGKADEVNQQLELLKQEFRQSHQLLDTKLDEIANNIEKILENQDNIEDFLMKKLGSDWDIIKDAWKDYKEGQINKKQLIFKCIRQVGVKFIKKIILDK